MNDYRNIFEQNFKRLLKERIYDRNVVKFEELLEEVTLATGLTLENQRSLKNWFEDVYLTKWLYDLIPSSNWEEIIVHNSQNATVYFGDRRIEVNMDLINTDFQLSLEILCFKNDQSWNDSNPFCSFNLIEKNCFYRATLIHKSLSPIEISKLSLRRHFPEHFELDCSSFGQGLDQLKELFLTNNNIVIAGSTGSGKTTLLNYLLKNYSKDEHAIILEDTSEISIHSHKWTKLLARPEDGKRLVDFCSYALRLRPDRIVVGEMRSNEIVPFVLAMNTGHRGLLSTIHANSASETFERMRTLFALYSNTSQISDRTISELISKGIDYIVYMKNKKIDSIIKLIGIDQGDLIFEQILHASA